MIDSLYFLQFACFIFMLINALILGITHLHMKWTNRRYEWSRWLILAGMTGLAIQYLLQMLLGFRAKSDDLGAIFNILVYTPCITTISMGIYNIEATHANRRKMNIVCACIYAAIIAVFCIGYSNSGSLNIGNWLYAMLVLFGANVAYCIYMIMIEIRKRKKMLELMTGGDMLPYVRYARASVFALFFSTLTMPFVILSTTLLYIIGPLALLSILFFNLSFVALGYNYVPTIIRKTKCYRFTKRNVPKRKTKRLRYRCPPEPYSNSVRTDFFSYSNAIILENQQINTSI